MNKDCIMMSIDSSTKSSGVAIFKNGELYKHHLLDFSNTKTMDESFPKMIKGLNKLLKHYSPTIVVIERMHVTRNVNVFRILCKILGCVQTYCIENNVEYIEVSPSQWRKYAKQSDKDKLPRKREELKMWSIARVKELYNLDVNDDVADSILIGYSHTVIMNESVYKKSV